MVDRELLELAARAGGVPAYWSVDGTVQSRPMFVVQAGGGMGAMPYEDEWNPLKDDGLALRLAVMLKIVVRNIGHQSFASSPLGQIAEYHDGDPCAATRRAIVRAAAELGRQMKLHNA